MERKFSVDELRRRLEPALRPAEPPTVEEVLEQVSRHGVLRGSVDWVFQAWIAYVEYATQEIMKTFQLTEEERRQLLDFRDTLKRLLLEAWMQTKEKLTTLYKAVAEGAYKLEGNKLYASDGTWMYVREGFAPYIIIHGVSASVRFPDILKLPRERLELLQLGWRASDEGKIDNHPFMGTTQPWQIFAWVTVRHGELYVYINSVNLTHEGATILIDAIAKDWRQKWSKDKAIDMVTSYFRCGEWTPMLTMWLGDGKSRRNDILHNKYKLVISAKEPWKLGKSISIDQALVATGKETFERLKEAAGTYGMLLDLMGAHKWTNIKLATDKDFRKLYKLKTKKRGIDVLRETYRRNNIDVSTEQLDHRERSKLRSHAVVVAGVEMSLHLVSSRSGSLNAVHYTRGVGEALEIAGRLEVAGLRPNIVKSNAKYVVYITATDLLKLAERDETVRKAIALYLVEKAKNGTPRQKEIARKFLQRHPLFILCHIPLS